MRRRIRAALGTVSAVAAPAALARLGFPAVLAAAAVALAAAALLVLVLTRDGPARRAALVIAAFRGTAAPPAAPAAPPALPEPPHRRWRRWAWAARPAGETVTGPQMTLTVQLDGERARPAAGERRS